MKTNHNLRRAGILSLFVRQAANLWHVKTIIWQLLIERSGLAQQSSAGH